MVQFGGGNSVKSECRSPNDEVQAGLRATPEGAFMGSMFVEAVFENGTFRLLTPDRVELAEGERVRLTIERIPVPVPAEELLAGLAKVFEGWTEEEIDEFERTFLHRCNLFGKRGASAP
jgi:predicted DNA-binding antitoxin AbrB/MazE fold protein